MPSRIVTRSICATLAASLMLAGAPALARTTPANIGHALFPQDHQYFTVSAGVGAPSSATPQPVPWIMPLILDFSGSKSIVVRGTAPAGSVLRCQAEARASNYNVASVSALVSFPVSDAMTSITLNLSSVPGGGMAFVTCLMQGRSFVTELDYAS